jgi:hypothetical protein
VASSKKPRSSQSKSSKITPEDSKIADAVTVEGETSSDKTEIPVVDGADTVVANPDDTAKTAKQEDIAETETSDKTVDEAKPDTAPNDTDTNTAEVTPIPPKDPPASEQAWVDEKSSKRSENAAQTSSPVAAPVEKKGSSFVPLVLGGVIAGAIGFFVAQASFFDSAEVDITAELRSELNSQQERIAILETAEPPQIESPTVDLSPLETQLTALEERIAALEERPAVVLPDGDDADAAEAYAAELEALRESVVEQRSEIAALLENTRSERAANAAAATAASAQRALAKIVSAIDTGQPFADEYSEIETLDIGELDPALGDVADEGVATLSALQTEFPEQARTALATARSSGVEDGQQGLGGFITRSLGARSVTPREGDDPDAVLSRAEAALNSGDLATTLNELDTLPEEAQAAIADWRAAAEARLEARMAVDDLAQRLTAD